jgi:hypothetical protein
MSAGDIDALVGAARLRDPHAARRTVANLKFLGVQARIRSPVLTGHAASPPRTNWTRRVPHPV